MGTRRNAASLLKSETETFIKALRALKNQKAAIDPAKTGGVQVSVYDQFVALHDVAMEVVFRELPGGPITVDMAHGSIGFAPWHRQYLRQFEIALQQHYPQVTLPYWDWADGVGSDTKVFVDGFMGPLPGKANPGIRAPKPLTSGNFTYASWPLHPYLPSPLTGGANSVLRRTLHRLGLPLASWPPSPPHIQRLLALSNVQPPHHDYWFFSRQLQFGIRDASDNVIAGLHNTGHNFVGGNMGGLSFSPNDPIFWLHHAYVDKLWDQWQSALGHAGEEGYPPAGAMQPGSTSSPAPPGSQVDDLLWPWVDGDLKYSFNPIQPEAKLLPDFKFLPEFAKKPKVTVRDTLSAAALGYQYE